MLGFGYLALEIRDKGAGVVLDLNHYVFLFLIVGMLLHWRPKSFVQAIAASVTPVGGVLIQYPMYAGIVRMLTESGLATQISHFFVSVSNEHTFPVMVGIYSAFLGLFIPSAGGKWLIEAPYLLEAGKSLGVHLGWVVQTYNATEALANLIHPFWMLPLVGILGLKARDIVGYSMLQFVVHVPLVLLLVWLLNYTLTVVARGVSIVTIAIEARSRRPLVALLALAAFAAVPQLSFAATVLITGANSGLGLEFAKQYAAKGWTVIATHRRAASPSRSRTSTAGYEKVRVERLDVTSADDVKALAAKLEGRADRRADQQRRRLQRPQRMQATTRASATGARRTSANCATTLFDTIMAVNVKGPLMVSEALLGNVKASTQKKIVAISSTNGSLTDELAGSGAIFYRTSKAALNRAMQLVATKEKDDGVTVVMLHPGAVVTEQQAYLEGFKGMLEMSFTVQHMIETIDKAHDRGLRPLPELRRHHGAVVSVTCVAAETTNESAWRAASRQPLRARSRWSRAADPRREGADRRADVAAITAFNARYLGSINDEDIATLIEPHDRSSHHDPAGPAADRRQGGERRDERPRVRAIQDRRDLDAGGDGRVRRPRVPERQYTMTVDTAAPAATSHDQGALSCGSISASRTANGE